MNKQYKLDQETLKYLVGRTNRAEHQTQFLYNVVGGNYVYLKQLEMKLKNALVSWCPENEEEVEYIMSLPNVCNSLDLAELSATSLVRTCFACPSQWQGHLTDGRMFYVRYRHGNLTVGVSAEPTNDVFDAVNGEMVFCKSIGDSLDGFMGVGEVMDYLKGVISFKNV